MISTSISRLSAVVLAIGGGAPVVLWVIVVPMAAMAVAYGALLLRGPFDALQPAT